MELGRCIQSLKQTDRPIRLSAWLLWTIYYLNSPGCSFYLCRAFNVNPTRCITHIHSRRKTKAMVPDFWFEVSSHFGSFPMKLYPQRDTKRPLRLAPIGNLVDLFGWTDYPEYGKSFLGCWHIGLFFRDRVQRFLMIHFNSVWLQLLLLLLLLFLVIF